MNRKTFDSPRGQVAYWMERNTDVNAPCIFFLHGLSADHTLFDFQVRYFSNRNTVIAWDAPAHAFSRPYSDFSYAGCVDDIYGILQSERIDRTVFVGQSMGGYLVQSFLIRHPQMASAFIAIDTCPYGNRYYSKSDLFWMKQTGSIGRWIPYQYYKDLIINSVAVTETGRENMRQALSFYNKREFYSLLDIGLKEFVRENCNLEITCPVLILVGEKDNTGKVLLFSKAWHEETGYPIELILNASHNSNIDNPDQVNAAIERFLIAVLR